MTTARELLAKAERASASAKLLPEAGDRDGACSRAFYAMHDAARAALLSAGVVAEAELPRTHSGLIAAFALHLVKSGRVALELGRALNRVEEIRLAADYQSAPVERDKAVWAVDQASTFVKAMLAEFAPKSDDPGKD